MAINTGVCCVHDIQVVMIQVFGVDITVGEIVLCNRTVSNHTRTF